MTWPKAITTWYDGRVGYMSIPFTWLLPEAYLRLRQGVFWADRWVVGGPAVKLLPDYLKSLSGVTIGGHHPGVLQRVNPQATRTTVGCPFRCEFCGIGQRRIEGTFRELDDWLDLPVVCDNNLLAASHRHFGRVIDRLKNHDWCDFNQGLDIRLLTPYHATRLAELKKPIIRLALDNDVLRGTWSQAVELLLSAGIPKSRIWSYVLVGFRDSPEEASARCRFVESHGVKALPMWFHRLDALAYNAVIEDQCKLGWTKRKQRELFCWYYQHRTLESRG